MAKYYWLRLDKDFFRQKEIKKLRKIAGGDTYTIIYQKMLLLSLQDEGRLFFDGIEDDFENEIALEIDEEVDNVRMTILFLIKNHLLEEVSNDECFLSAVPQMIGKESDSASRVRKYRENKKLLAEKNVKPLHCNKSNVTCNTEIEKDIEKDIELDIELDKRKKNRDSDESQASKSKKVSINFDEIKQTFNNICIDLPSIKSMTDKRKSIIREWLKEDDELNLLDFFKKVNESDYLNGKVVSWKADFDWIIKKDKRVRILEGSYDNLKNNGKTETDYLKKMLKEEEERAI